MGVFHHLSNEDCQQVFSELKRVVKPEGLLLIMEDTKSKSPLTEFIHYLDQGDYIRAEKELD